ncbi:MAG TPA: DUF1641 domain-containing protein [Bacillus bacterium]|nr:DUF1641 domain-containing protein [Bacillus sp. (in: firmicutes)]
MTERISEDVQDELIEMLPVFLRTMNLLKMVGDTMTEESIVALTEKAEKSADLLNFLGDERLTTVLAALIDKSDQLVELLNVLDRIVVLQKNGALDRLFELAEVVGVFTDALTEPTIQHIVDRSVPLLELGERIASSPIIKNTPAILDAVEKTTEEMKTASPPTLSVMGLLKIMKQKEIQHAAHFGVAFLKNLGAAK